MEQFNKIPGFGEDLSEVEKKLRAFVRDPYLREPLSTIISAVLDGEGKRLRPSVLLISARLGPDYGANRDRLTGLAAVMELTHTASLIHDDIVDDAATRRGRPTVQSAFGKDMAVYAGDYLLSKVLSYLMKNELTHAGSILAKCIADMCAGEIAQYESQFDTAIDESKYFVNIAGKTAALFSASCEIGAAEAGCDRETVSYMSRFGHTLGILFQMRDDLIDCLSSGKKEGKETGSDFRRGIYTLPVIYSFIENGLGPELKELANAFREGKGSEKQLERVRLIINESGGVEYTRWMIRQYRDRALGLLSKLQDHIAVRALEEAVDFLAEC
jgi:heptaprenyl diphosphate synthase